MRVSGFLFLFATAVFGQVRAGTPLYPGGAPGPHSPTPSVLRPGTPTQAARLPVGAGGVRPPGMGVNPGRPGNGVGPGYLGQGRPGTGRQQPRRTVIVPFGVPYYGYGPGYGPGYNNGYNQDDYAGQGPIEPQPGQQGVYLNRDYQPERINPVTRDYSNVPLPETMPPDNNPVRVYDAPVYVGPQRPDAEPTIYLLALKDQSVIPVLAYWVEGDTVRYVTRQHSMNLISLDLVDRQFSTKLNRERNVEFSLPQ